MNINYLPQGERLLSGSLSLLLTDVATTATVSTPPSASKLPCYFEFEPDSTANRELTRVIGVSGSVVTLERGLNNGGVGIAHQANSAYKQKITSLHINALADALQNGYLLEDAIRALIRVSATQLTITGYGASDDLSAFYTAGRYIRVNSSDSNIFRITSSSYSAGTNKTTVNISGTLPGTLTTLELSLAGRGIPDLIADRKATGAEIDTGTDDTKIVTPKAMEDSSYAKGTVPVKATGAELKTGTDDAKFATAKALVDAGISTIDHIVLTPTTSKLVKIATLHQKDDNNSITNSYLNNTIILTGYTQAITPASSPGQVLNCGAITFGITFSAVPTPIGGVGLGISAGGATPATSIAGFEMSFDSLSKMTFVCIETPAVAGTGGVRIVCPTTLVVSTYYGATWAVIGVLN